MMIRGKKFRGLKGGSFRPIQTNTGKFVRMSHIQTRDESYTHLVQTMANGSILKDGTLSLILIPSSLLIPYHYSFN